MEQLNTLTMINAFMEKLLALSHCYPMKVFRFKNSKKVFNLLLMNIQQIVKKEMLNRNNHIKVGTFNLTNRQRKIFVELISRKISVIDQSFHYDISSHNSSILIQYTLKQALFMYQTELVAFLQLFIIVFVKLILSFFTAQFKIFHKLGQYFIKKCFHFFRQSFSFTRSINYDFMC